MGEVEAMLFRYRKFIPPLRWSTTTYCIFDKHRAPELLRAPEGGLKKTSASKASQSVGWNPLGKGEKAGASQDGSKMGRRLEALQKADVYR